MRNQSDFLHGLGKVEILGRDEILGWQRRRRRQGIQQLKARAASGDPRAIARLRRLQAELAAPATSSTTSTTNAPTLFAYPQATPPTPYATPTYAQPAYSQYAAPAPAYQTPYFDPSLSQDPYGPAPQPTIDVFQGDDLLGVLLDANLDPMKPRDSEFMLGAFVGDDEIELAREGGSSERAALNRRVGHPFARIIHNIRKQKIADDKKLPIEKKIDTSLLGDPSGKQLARKILEASKTSKSISRDSLKKAIWLYAGTPSTEAERTAVGKKMLVFLNKQQVILS